MVRKYKHNGLILEVETGMFGGLTIKDAKGKTLAFVQYEMKSYNAAHEYFCRLMNKFMKGIE